MRKFNLIELHDAFDQCNPSTTNSNSFQNQSSNPSVYAGYIRLVRLDNLFLFVGTLSLVRSMGPELLAMIIKY